MKRSPFTALCQQTARLAKPRRADLHVHTTASDGEYTASQVVELARRAELVAVAVTDHDTLAGVGEAVAAARAAPAPAVEVVAGVEITTDFDGRELHLLGYFVRPDHPDLTAALAGVCASRRARFHDYVTQLGTRGLVIPADRVERVGSGSVSLGRRHVAGLLLACGHARTQNEAFYRHIHPLRTSVPPKERIPLAGAIALVHAAGGVASLAHPPADLAPEQFGRMRDFGLDAVEAEYAWGRSAAANRLREVAARFGFAVTGGSDCHGPVPAHRQIGSYAITADELGRLRGRCGQGAGPVAAARP